MAESHADVVYRYLVGPSGSTIQVPGDAVVVQVDHAAHLPGLIDVWVLQDPDGDPVDRRLVLAGTGHVMPSGAVHVASTARDPRTGLVWHLFEIEARTV